MINRIFFVVIFMFLCATDAASDEADPHREVDSSFVLCPGSVTGPLFSITWRHEYDLAVDWSEDDVTHYHIFKGRSSLNTTSGCLTLSNVTHDHSGLYTPVINYKYENHTEIKVISPVAKPTVSTHCNDEKTHCNLTCEGNITDDHGPVKFIWILGHKSSDNRPGNKTFKITQEDQEDFISCRLENPFSFKQSENLPNPLINRNRVYSFSVGPGVIGTILGLLVLLVLLSVFLMWFRIKLKGLLPTSTPNGTSVNSPEMNNKPDEPTDEKELMEVTVDDNDDTGPEPEHQKEKHAVEEDQKQNLYPA